MSTLCRTTYLSIGANRRTAASAWSKNTNVLAFGADRNVAVWFPTTGDKSGIQSLLRGHKDIVTAVTFLSLETDVEGIISASADGQLRLTIYDPTLGCWSSSAVTDGHGGAINALMSAEGSDIISTGGSDAKIKIWRVSTAGFDLLATIETKPRFIPLALVLGAFPGVSPKQSVFLAAAGTRNDIQVYSIDSLSDQASVAHQATLTGHAGWVNYLSLKHDSQNSHILASASHDKYVRLWRFSTDSPKAPPGAINEDTAISFEQTLSAKTRTVEAAGSKLQITFDALLLGHEDWVYSASWNPSGDSLQLLTASADGTLAIWEPDPSSGIWISVYRLGELSGQKGATTATGSAGGFWTGLWSPDGTNVACIGRTGSWRLWRYDPSSSSWVPNIGISGHVSPVNDMKWSASGEYLLTTGSDQTTRLHAEWQDDDQNRCSSWHEFARPQIHGYDLNCLAIVNDQTFVSGADEKLLRVFKEPQDIADMLHRLCLIAKPNVANLPESAAVPVLGLSNKAIDENEEEAHEESNVLPQQSLSEVNRPPTEDTLSRHTLWPEYEKLYGHGYEISACAASIKNSIIATACKASSLEHAVIRLYNTDSWNEIKPSLTAHSLTVTRLAFSPGPEKYLLSVGRDRQWSIFEPDVNDPGQWSLSQANAKAHARMILDAAWSPLTDKPFFATAGRDKITKIWHQVSGTDTRTKNTTFRETLSIKGDQPITSINFTALDGSTVLLACAAESGNITLHVIEVAENPKIKRSVDLPQAATPSKSITRLMWRPTTSPKRPLQLAAVASDGSVRILTLHRESILTSQ